MLSLFIGFFSKVISPAEQMGSQAQARVFQASPPTGCDEARQLTFLVCAEPKHSLSDGLAQK